VVVLALAVLTVAAQVELVVLAAVALLLVLPR